MFLDLYESVGWLLIQRFEGMLLGATIRYIVTWITDPALIFTIVGRCLFFYKNKASCKSSSYVLVGASEITK